MRRGRVAWLAGGAVAVMSAGCTALGLFDGAPAVACLDTSDCQVPGLIEDSCVRFACDVHARICVGHLNDGDGDGQAAVGCAASAYADTGTATDCDDTDGATYDGALEVCSGTDNDCDGRVDEACAAPHLAVGATHSCYLAGPELVCWGANDEGELGLGDVEPRGGHPRRVAGVETAVDVFAGWNDTCVVLADGRVLCWGADDHGQLGIAAMPARRVRPTEIPALAGATHLALGKTHSCGLLGGDVACWGDNLLGQLGDGTTVSRPEPMAVPGTHGALAVAVGEGVSCAVLADRTISCWGASPMLRACATFGSEPCTVPDLADADDVTIGSLHACATRSSAPPVCWGDDDLGQRGGPATMELWNPIVFDGPVDQLRAGALHSCLVSSGALWCWGSDQLDQVGQGLMQTIAEPLRTLPDVVDFTEAGAGLSHTCALRSTGDVLCWGNNYAGQLGRWGDIGMTIEPVRPLANWALDGSP
jgi:hypothetical protein